MTDLLRRHRNQRATRWRKLTVGRRALLVLAHLRKGETYADLACASTASAWDRQSRSCPTRTADLVPAVQTPMIAGA